MKNELETGQGNLASLSRPVRSPWGDAHRFVKWEDAFRVGHVPLDQRREELFHLVNEVWACRKKSMGERKAVFRRLCDHLEAHWALEEALCTTDCPTAAEHQQQHAVLRRQLEGIHVSFGINSQSWHNLMMFLLQDLLLHHMIASDISCKRCLKPAP